MSELPIVLLPGSMCDERVFEHQLAHFGDRATVADLTRAATIEGLAADVLAHAPGRFAAVGLSLGAIVAVEMAMQEPDRIVALALLDTNLGPMDPVQAEHRMHWRSQARSGELPTVVAGSLIDTLTAYPERHGSRIFEMARDLGPGVFLDQNDALLARRDRRPDFAEIRRPILVACGDQDTICPPAMHTELAARSPNARLEVFDDCGHLSTLDQPTAVTGTLTEWLESCTTPTIPGGVSK